MSDDGISRYVLKQKLREIGGYLTVFAASEPALEREVHLRVLQVLIAANSEAHAKFQAECRALAGLDHPGILKILDLGHSADRVFYVTDPPPGVPLAECIALGPVDPEVVIEAGVQLSQALDYLHGRGLVHRGLSPAGVNLDMTSGRVVICDFSLLKDSQGGMATLRDLVDADRFELLPERQKGAPADARSDVFMAGALLYGLATGKDPLAPANLARTVDYEFEPLAAVGAEFPQELDRVVRKALAADPAARQQSADELARELEGVRRKAVARKVSRAMATPPGAVSGRLRAANGAPDSRSRPELPAATRPAGPSMAALAVAGAVLLAVGLAGGASFMAGRETVAESPRITLQSLQAPRPDAVRAVPRPDQQSEVSGPPSAIPSDPADVLALAATARRDPTTEKTFLNRWDALATWSDELPPSPTGAAAPFVPTDLRVLRLKIFRQPRDACADLDRLLQKAEDYLRP